MTYIRVNQWTSKLNRFVFTIVILCLCISLFPAQAQTCPIVPSGLKKVSDLEWGEYGQTVKLLPGINAESRYLRSGLEWNITSGELKPTVDPLSAIVIQLAEKLSLSEKFLKEIDSTHLAILPSSKYALFTTKEPTWELFAVQLDNLKPVYLGHLSQNLSKLNYDWYSDAEAIITVEPIYGDGYQVYDVCLDGSCFVSLSDFIQTSFQKPSSVNANQLVAVYSVDPAKLWVYSLETKKIISEFSLSMLPLANLNPIWSQDGKSVYFVGFNEDKYKSRLVVYRFDFADEKLVSLTQLDRDIDDINEWLIDPNARLIVLSVPAIRIMCY